MWVRVHGWLVRRTQGNIGGWGRLDGRRLYSYVKFADLHSLIWHSSPFAVRCRLVIVHLPWRPPAILSCWLLQKFYASHRIADGNKIATPTVRRYEHPCFIASPQPILGYRSDGSTDLAASLRSIRPSTIHERRANEGIKRSHRPRSTRIDPLLSRARIAAD